MAVIVYYVLLVLGYGWALVQLFSTEPFDALVLFWVTFYLNTYRNAVVKEVQNAR